MRLLTLEDWGGTYPKSWTPDQKGRAIDRALRNETGSIAPEMESFDLELEIPETNIRWHEFKSTSTGSVTVKRSELDLAARKYRDGFDLLYWVCWQHPARDEYSLEYFIRYSTLFENNRFIASKFREGEVYFVFEACRKLGFKLA